jgi:hypothetical protein
MSVIVDIVYRGIFPCPTSVVLVTSTVLAAGGCTRDSDGHTGSDGQHSTATSGGDSEAGESTDGADTGPFDMPAKPDLPGAVCEGTDCWAYDFGECEAGDACAESGHSCAFTHGLTGAPGVCALKARELGALDDPCESYDAGGLQTCGAGLTCLGVADAPEGNCVEWCDHTLNPSIDPPRGTCSRSDDICIQAEVPELGGLGGWCAHRCNPSLSDACGGIQGQSCHDVGTETLFQVDPGEDGSNVHFVCVPVSTGTASLREDCSSIHEHHPASSAWSEPPPCIDGLTCAHHQFADQPDARRQCIRICDAPEDCPPTETCVSSLEFTESVGEPVGVCEVL